MPDSYFPASRNKISDEKTTKSGYGLPENGFVFCCFNNNYKLGPEEFDIWMRCMKAVEGSVLWLLKSTDIFEANIKREAARRGISEERIIFASPVSHEKHLERHKHADLFLDTFNYNAHTTTVDAIWAGLPLITKAGGSFAARAAASILCAANLPELVTHSEKDYENTIVKLATDPQLLNDIKNKIAKTKTQMTLFDSQLYARNLETAYKMAYNQHVNGQPPSALNVKENDRN